MLYRIHHLGGERISCRDIDCAAYRNGWETHIDETAALGQRQAAYIRYKSNRQFKERCDEKGITVFVFERGQRCFGAHVREYASFQKRRGREDFQNVTWDRFKGEWNETSANIRR